MKTEDGGANGQTVPSRGQRATASANEPIRSWDDKNIEAVLIQCVTCRLWWWMTHPNEVCIACR